MHTLQELLPFQDNERIVTARMTKIKKNYISRKIINGKSPLVIGIAKKNCELKLSCISIISLVQASLLFFPLRSQWYVKKKRIVSYLVNFSVEIHIVYDQAADVLPQ